MSHGWRKGNVGIKMLRDVKIIMYKRSNNSDSRNNFPKKVSTGEGNFWVRDFRF